MGIPKTEKFGEARISKQSLLHTIIKEEFLALDPAEVIKILEEFLKPNIDVSWA